MSNPHGVSCGTCPFYAHDDVDQGECRRHPLPLATRARYWCAEHPAFFGHPVEEETALDQAAEEVLEALVPWAKAASRVPRAKGSPEDVLLEAVKRWVVARSDQETEETP